MESPSTRHRTLLSPAIVQHLSVPIVVVDSAKKAIAVNEAASNLIGISPQDCYGVQIQMLHPLLKQLDQEGRIERVLTYGQSVHCGEHFVTPRGHTNERCFHVTVDPLRDESDITYAASITLMDITELVQARERVVRQKNNLELVHSVSHSLRSSLKLSKALFIICSSVTGVFSERFTHASVYLVGPERRMRGLMATGPMPKEAVIQLWEDLKRKSRKLKSTIMRSGTQIQSQVQKVSEMVKQVDIDLEDHRSVLARAVNLNEVIVGHTDNFAGLPDALTAYLTIGEFAALPLISDAKPIGVLMVGAPRDAGSFDEDGLTLLSLLADLAAVAVSEAQLFAEAQRRADHDSLTDLYNHGALMSRLNDEMNRANRYAPDHEGFSLLMIDIDHFKGFNDTYGHQTGDKVLVNLARLLQATARKSDICARYGGEEFAIILPETDGMQASMLAERIRSTVQKTTLVTDPEGQGIPVTVTIGVASYPSNAKTVDDLIARADEALYDGKRGGRNTVCFSQPTA